MAKQPAITITMQELRKDPRTFLQQINSGKAVSVVYHSRIFATVKSADKTTAGKQPKGAAHYAALAKQAAGQTKQALDPNKSIKQLYAESIAQKYDIY